MGGGLAGLACCVLAHETWLKDGFSAAIRGRGATHRSPRDNAPLFPRQTREYRLFIGSLLPYTLERSLTAQRTQRTKPLSSRPWRAMNAHWK
jgi:hypothetical protein